MQRCERARQDAHAVWKPSGAGCGPETGSLWADCCTTVATTQCVFTQQQIGYINARMMSGSQFPSKSLPPAAEHPQLTCFRPASLLTRVKRGVFSGPSGMNRIHTCLQAREQPATRANASENKTMPQIRTKHFFSGVPCVPWRGPGSACMRACGNAFPGVY